MRFLFIVQGEGRGHMTQALALSSVLRRQGHEITRVVVGRSERRTIPDFFLDKIQSRVYQVDSPNFVTDNDQKSVSLMKSIWLGLRRLGVYRSSLKQLDQMVKEDQPDVIINFYDFIGGLYNGIKKPKSKFVCIAHQYLAGHSTFEFPEGPLLDRSLMKLGNSVTSFGADQRLALSFQELPDEPGIEVVPPLLRKEVTDLVPEEQDHLLVYMLNHGYSAEVDVFHRDYPDQKLECFWDKPEAPEKLEIDDKLTYHRLNGELFIEKMRTCKGFLTTAGFESVCEAMYLGKPVMMMPVEGHYEQACNALDAQKVGAGISSKSFDLKKLLEYLPKHVDKSEKFRHWCDRSEPIFLAKLVPRSN